MKRHLSIAIALATVLPSAAMAEMTWYGKANVSFEQTNEGDDSYTSLLSNASRIGVKGSEEVSDGITAIYKFEYEAFVDDGDTFSQRNIYVGVKGGFGQVIAGNFDTPTKAAQNKIDLFGDLRGDIKNVITVNENRVSNIVMYSTPTSSGFAANVAHISREEDDADSGISASVTYSMDNFYAAVAYDQDVEEIDSDVLRLVLQGNFGALQLGALYEQFDAESNADKLDATFISAAYDLGEKTTLKAQYGQSDQQAEGGDSLSVGADFKYTRNFKSFVYYTAYSADNDVLDNDYAGVGVELKF